MRADPVSIKVSGVNSETETVHPAPTNPPFTHTNRVEKERQNLGPIHRMNNMRKKLEMRPDVVYLTCEARGLRNAPAP